MGKTVSSNTTPELDKKEREKEQLYNYRLERFIELLGEDWPLDDIVVLMENKIDYHDLRRLLEAGCKKDLAVKILL